MRMRIIKRTGIFLAALLLCGCSARELEDRLFAQAMELNLDGDGLVGGFGDFLVQGDTVEEIRENYQGHLDKYLDLGHIKAIVLGRALLDDGEKLREVLLELEQMPVISSSSLVFSYAYPARESYLEKLKEHGREPGEYLSDLYENNPLHAEAVTLGDMLGEKI